MDAIKAFFVRLGQKIGLFVEKEYEHVVSGFHKMTGELDQLVERKKTQAGDMRKEASELVDKAINAEDVVKKAEAGAKKIRELIGN